MPSFLASRDSQLTLVGRDRELEQLAQALRMSRARRGSTVLISGEAGIGKTQLLMQLRDQAIALGMTVLQGHSYDPGTSPPYGPWRQIVSDHQLTQALPSLPALFGEHVLVDPVQNQSALFSEVVHLTGVLASERPLVLMFEDIQWADAGSIDLMRAVGRQSNQHPIMIVATYRSEEVTREHPLYRRIPALRRETQALRIDLQPLDTSALTELVRELVSVNDDDLQRLVAYVQQRAQGNPFFTQELLYALEDEGVLSTVDGQWTLAPNATSGDVQPVPELVRQVIDHRLDRLGPGIRRPMELAAIIGHEVSPDLWRALSDPDEESFITVIRKAVESQFLQESPDGRVLRFRHALVRDALYTAIVLPDRHSLHTRCGEYLATHYPSDPDRVAHHFAQAHDPRAIEWLTRSGKRALVAYAPDNAIQRLSQAFELAENLSLEPDATMSHLRGRAHAMVGEFRKAERDYTIALERARQQSERPIEWTILVDLGTLWSERNYSKTHDFYNQALDLARVMGDEPAIAHSLNRIGNWYLNNDRPADAIQRHHEARQMFHDQGDIHGLAQTTRMLGMSYLVGGDLLQSNHHFRDAVDLFTSLDDRLGVCAALTTLIYTSGTYTFHTEVTATLEPGEYEEFSTRALELAVATHWKSGEAHVCCALGSYHGIRGNYREALEFTGRGLRIATEIGHREWMALAHQILGRLHLDLFVIDEAGQHLERSLALAETAGAPIHARLARSYLAHVYVASGMVERALETLEQAFVTDQEVRTVIERKCLAARASLALGTGDAQLALSISGRLLQSTINGSDSRIVPLYGRLHGEALTQLGLYPEAEQQLLLALDAAATGGFRPVQWRLAAALGRLYRAWGSVQEANDWFSQARHLIEDLAESIPDDRLRKTYLVQSRDRIPTPRPRTQLQSAKHEFSGLTARQREVAALVALGHSNADIADTLSISPRTAEGHVTAILTTLNFTSRAQIAAWAVDRKIVEL